MCGELAHLESASSYSRRKSRRGLSRGTPGRTRGTSTRSARGRIVQRTGAWRVSASPSTPAWISGASASITTSRAGNRPEREGGRRLDAPGQVRVVGVHAGVEDGDLHIASGKAGQVGPDRLQAPGPVLLVPGRALGSGDFGPGVAGDHVLVAAVGREELGRRLLRGGDRLGVDHALRLSRDDRVFPLGRGHRRVYIVRLVGFGAGFGPLRPRNRVRGLDMAGRVEAVGKNVTRFRPGEAVFGMGAGSLAEYACAQENALAPMPANLAFEQAAAVPEAASTALLGLRTGRIEAGQRVLINGASGGVGTFAVQLARAFGANVTGVCSARNVDLVRSIGASQVVDYTREDFTQGAQHVRRLRIAAGRTRGSVMPRRGQRTAHPAAVARRVRPAETSRIGVRRIVVERRGGERTWHIDPGVFACSLLAAQLADEWVLCAEATGIRDPGGRSSRP